jgi:hypothetical protein
MRTAADKPRSAYALGFAICRALAIHAKPHRVLLGAEARIVHGLTLPDLMTALRELHTPSWVAPSNPTTVRRACNDLKAKGLVRRASIPQDRAPAFALFYMKLDTKLDASPASAPAAETPS